MKKKETIGNYEIIELLQEIPEWNFYRAFDKTTQERILLKVYFPLYQWSDANIGIFLNRLSYLKYVEHINLLPILDFGKYNQAPYIIFSDLFDISLETYLIRQKTVNKVLLSTFVQLADALGFLHKNNIVHGLLTPQNTIMTSEHTLKLMDYGVYDILTEVLLSNSQEYFQNLSVQNIKYASPEQILENAVSPQSDIYTFGTIFYYGITGKFPFKAEFSPEIALFHITEKHHALKEPLDVLSDRASRIVRKCLDINSKIAFKDFSEITLALKQLIKRRKIRNLRNKTSFFNPKRRNKTKPIYSILTLLALISLATLLQVRDKFTIGKVMESLAPPSATLPPSHIEELLPTLPTPVPMEASHPHPTELATPIISEVTVSKPFLEESEIKTIPETLNLDNLKNIKEISHLGYGKPESVAISPDQKHYGIATSSGVFIFSQTNQQEVWIDSGGWATSICFSPDGKLLGIGLASGEIQVWDWKNETKKYALIEHTEKISSLLFSPNNRILYSSSYDQNVIAWDLMSGQPLQSIRASSDAITKIAVSHDGRILMSGSIGNVRMWDLATGQQLYEFHIAGRVESIAISSDDQYLAAGSDRGFIHQWNIKSKQLRTDPIPAKSIVWYLKYIENDTRLFAGLDNGKTAVYISSIQSYPGVSLDFHVTQDYMNLIDTFGTQYEFSSSFATYNDAPNKSVSIYWDGRVKNQEEIVLEQNYGLFNRLIFSSSSTLIAVGSEQGVTSVWSIPKNHLLYRDKVTLPKGNAISPDDAYIVVIPTSIRTMADKDKYQLLVSLNGKQTKVLYGAISDATVGYSSDGTLLISNTFRSSNIWDIQSGDDIYFKAKNDRGCRITISSKDNKELQVYSIAGTFPRWHEQMQDICAKSFLYRGSLVDLSANLATLIYVDHNRIIEAFDVLEKKVIWQFNPADSITALAISGHGTIVAVGYEDGRVVFIDGQNGNAVSQIVGNYGTVNAIRFSPDGNWLATSGSDGVVRLFGVVSEQ